ncbi:MAG: protein TolR [Rickettsiaceae bacterium]|nr:protein TolR [Rickettsiaceae bacterium]
MQQLYSKRYKKRHLKNEINVTPMVDVMLVLLIIFMITSPMIIAGIEVNLPKTQSATIKSSANPLVLSINAKGAIYLFETQIAKESLIQKLAEITKDNKDEIIYVKGDKSLDYGSIIKLIAKIKTAGFTKVSLISEIED